MSDVLDVRITQSDIDKGRKNSFTDCPIALALKRHGYLFPKVSPFEGETGAIWFYSAPTSPTGNETRNVARVTMSRKARVFAKAFDNGDKVEPYRLRLSQALIFVEAEPKGCHPRYERTYGCLSDFKRVDKYRVIR